LQEKIHNFNYENTEIYVQFNIIRETEEHRCDFIYFLGLMKSNARILFRFW